MASSPKLISFFFLLTLFSIQIYARESQFFSKVSGTTTTTVPTTTTTINSKDNTFPNKEEEPTFMQETQNGYGLYGHESYDQESNTQFPTTTNLGNQPDTTTTTYNPYNTQTQTESQKTYTNYPNTNSNYYKNNQYTNNGYYQEQQQQKNFGETSLQESSYTTMTNQNNNKYYTNNGANGYNQGGKQGMSDTRYLNDGKYFHDLKAENNNYPNQYRNSNNNYDTRAYSNFNDNNKYSMESQQEDFQDSQDEQYVP